MFNVSQVNINPQNMFAIDAAASGDIEMDVSYYNNKKI